MVARDGGVPPLSVTETVSIQVSREQNTPMFEQSEYTLDLPEGTERGAMIQRVFASDPDVSILPIHLFPR